MTGPGRAWVWFLSAGASGTPAAPLSLPEARLGTLPGLGVRRQGIGHGHAVVHDEATTSDRTGVTAGTVEAKGTQAATRHERLDHALQRRLVDAQLT